MSKELKALEKIDHTICLAFNDNNEALFNKDNETHIDCKDIYEFCDCYDIIETALKSNKRKLDLIGEVLVDVSKGNYADLNDAINEIREVLESE